MAAAQNRRDGTSYPVPEIFELDESKPGFGNLVQNVPLALVTENNGRVVNCHIFTRTIEVMGWGGGRDNHEISAAHIPMAADFLKRRGYDSLLALVPKLRATDAQSTLLETYGLHRVDNRLAMYFKEL
jgi:hypothetical protein